MRSFKVYGKCKYEMFLIFCMKLQQCSGLEFKQQLFFGGWVGEGGEGVLFWVYQVKTSLISCELKLCFCLSQYLSYLLK